MGMIDNWLKQKQNIWLLGAAFIFNLVVSYAGYLKLLSQKYNALDLAIFSNVLANFKAGNGLFSSINLHHYFADHFSLLMHPLAWIYQVFPSPLTLIVIQTLVLSLTIWPVYRIASHWFNQKWSIGLSLFWLLHPFIFSIGLFEFHLVSFSLLFILWALVFLLERKFNYFILWSVLALVSREDITIIVFAFGIIALIEKRAKKWMWSAFIMSAVWFLIAQIVINIFSIDSYRYLIYYSWIWREPLTGLSYFFSVEHLILLLGLFFPFLFIPLLARKWLWLAFLPWIEFVFLAGGPSTVVLQSHYMIFFVPALLIGFIHGLHKLLHQKNYNFSFLLQPQLIVIVLTALIIYSHFTLAALVPVFSTPHQSNPANLSGEHQLVSTRYLSELSTNPNLYTIRYVFFGNQQFSDQAYTPPQLDHAVISLDEIVGLYLQYPDKYQEGLNRITFTLNDHNLKPSLVNQTEIEYIKGGEGINIVEKVEAVPDDINKLDDDTLLGFNQAEYLELWWQADFKSEAFLLEFTKNNGHKELWPWLGDWQVEQQPGIYVTRYDVTDVIAVQLVQPQGTVVLDRLSSTHPLVNSKNPISPVILLAK